MFSKPTTRCEKCGTVVTKNKFLNKTFYQDAKGSLFGIVGKKARVQGCVNCLNILEAHEVAIEKAEFEHRTIYTLRPGFIESLQIKIKDFFNLKTKKGVPHE